MCTDVELCDKIDALNATVETLVANQSSDNVSILYGVENMSMWLQALVFILIGYFLYKAVTKNLL